MNIQKRSIDELVEYPEYLGYDLEIIMLRFDYLDKRMKLKPNLSLKTILGCRESDFATLMAKTTVAKYYQFKNWWKCPDEWMQMLDLDPETFQRNFGIDEKHDVNRYLKRY